VSGRRAAGRPEKAPAESPILLHVRENLPKSEVLTAQE
jgi:hypothetical protein